MASSLSEQQRMKIEKNRQRALALRAARQQQQQQQQRTLIASDCSRNSSLANSCQSVTSMDVTSTRSSPFSPSPANPLSAGSGSTYVRKSSSTVCPRTTAKCSSVQPSATLSANMRHPTTLADSSNCAPAAVVSRGNVASSARVPVKCCLVSRYKFAADCRYFAPLVEVFKSVPSKQYGDELNWTFFVLFSLLSIGMFRYCPGA